MTLSSCIFERLAGLIPDIIGSLQSVAECIWLSGWAEANAGNVSINISEELRTRAGEFVSPDSTYYLVSKTGSRYRQMKDAPLRTLVLIEDNAGEIAVYPEDAKPTSEWISHLEIQRNLIRQGSDLRVVLHTHPTELVALSGLPIYTTGEYLHTRLFDLLPELRFYIPEGIAFCEYAIPGTEDLSRITMKRMENKKAIIWQKHGLVCLGKTPDEALDYTELVNKAAKVWFLTSEK